MNRRGFIGRVLGMIGLGASWSRGGFVPPSGPATVAVLGSLYHGLYGLPDTIYGHPVFIDTAYLNRDRPDALISASVIRPGEAIVDGRYLFRGPHADELADLMADAIRRSRRCS